MPLVGAGAMREHERRARGGSGWVVECRDLGAGPDRDTPDTWRRHGFIPAGASGFSQKSAYFSFRHGPKFRRSKNSRLDVTTSTCGMPALPGLGDSRVGQRRAEPTAPELGQDRQAAQLRDLGAVDLETAAADDAAVDLRHPECIQQRHDLVPVAGQQPIGVGVDDGENRVDVVECRPANHRFTLAQAEPVNRVNL